jgi:outer membrane protein OmpA-like peptidoglycan-associated protein
MRTYAFAPLLLLFLSGFSQAFSQVDTELDPGYYIVVGAYAPNRENIAKNYTDILKRRGFNSGYGFNSTKNYYFVYMEYFTDLKSSLSEMQKLRRQPEFASSWVRVVAGDIAAAKAKRENSVTSATPPEPVRQPVVEKPVETKPTVVQTEPVVQKSEPVVQKTEPVKQTAAPVLTASTSDNIVVTDNPPIKQFAKITLGNTEVFLSLYNSSNNRIVDGVVRVYDKEKNRLLKEVKGNEYLILPDPKTKSGQLTLVCEAFGYRKVQHEINYAMPLSDTTKADVELLGTTFVINFDLTRYKSGDVGTLGNIIFYNDAALMMPDSRPELNGLLQLMQENKNYRIRLHGHTNGNYSGRIITLGEKKNFFSLDGSKQRMGTAKDLSFERAEVIKEYLEANGIDPSRIEVKGWGGKKPIFDKNSVNAKRNVRVEVEFL